MQTTWRTRLCAVLAHPPAPSIPQALLSGVAEATSTDLSVLTFDASLRTIIEPITALRTLRARGAYLDGRLRCAASGQVDYLSDEAHGADVINLITFDTDTATGHNTEAMAMQKLLEPHRERLTGGVAVIFGSGTVARSAAYILTRHFRIRHLLIAARSTQQGALLRDHIGGMFATARITVEEMFPPDLVDAVAEARIIVNATPIGSPGHSEATPFPIEDVFGSRQIVLDAVLHSEGTRLLQAAAGAGATTISGDELMVEQIGAAWQILTERPAPHAELRRLLDAHLSPQTA